MKYSISVVNEDGNNYFLACYEDMRFLFRRLNASSLIASPESDDMDKFEVRRRNGIIIAGDCYNLCGKNAVFLIHYSEIASYNPRRNTSSPHENLFASDFEPDDLVFSNVNAQHVKAKGIAATISFMDRLDSQMQSLRNGLHQPNIQMLVSATQSFIRRIENNQDALGLKTFIVPESF